MKMPAESRNHRLLECHRLRWFFSPLKVLQQLLSVAQAGGFKLTVTHPSFDAATHRSTVRRLSMALRSRARPEPITLHR